MEGLKAGELAETIRGDAALELKGKIKRGHGHRGEKLPREEEARNGDTGW